MKSRLLVVAMCLLTVTSTFAAPEMTDSEAKQLLEKRWNTGSDKLRLGSLVVMKDGWVDPTHLEKGIISVTDFRTYQAYEKIGVISIQENPVFQYQKNTAEGFDQLVEESGGIERALSTRGKFIVNTTPKGEALAQRWNLPQQQGWFFIKWGTFRLEKVVKNEAHRKGADDYRVINFPFAQSLSNILNFKLSVESSTQPQPWQDCLLQP